MLRYILYLMIVFAMIFVLYELFYKVCEFIGKYDNKVTDAAEQIREEHQRKIENERQKVINKQSQNASSSKSYNTNTNTQNNTNTKNNGQGSGNNVPPPSPKKEEKKIPDCLTVLGFIKEPENSEEIRARYKKLIRIYHPDEGGSDEEFERVNKAYEEAKKLYHIN